MFRTLFISLSFVFLILFASFSGQSAYAQSSQNSSVVTPGISASEADLAAWAGVLDSITQGLTRDGLTASELDGFFEEADRIRNLASAEVTKIEPRVNELNQQLAELGEAPSEDAPAEALDVQERRNALSQQLARLVADLRASNLAVVRTRQIQSTITQEKQTRFFGSISTRDTNVITTKFWGKFLGSFKTYFRSLELLFNDSFSIMIGEFKKKPWKILSLLFFLSLFALVFIRVRKLIAPRAELGVVDVDFDFYNSRFVRFCRQGILPVVLIYAIYELFDFLFLLTARFDEFLAGIIFPICFYIMATVLLRIVLLPNAQGERISGVSDLAANKVCQTIKFGMGLGFAISIVNTTSRVLISPVEVTIGLSFLFSLVIGGMSFLTLWVLHNDNVRRAELFETSKRPRFFLYLNVLIWIVTIGIIGATLVGYVAMGEFLSQQLLFGLVVIGIAWLFLRAIDGLFAIAAPEIAMQGAHLPDATQDASSNQLAILGAGVMKLIVYVASGILLMLPWGYRTSDFFQIFKNAFFGFEIGGLSFSISTILLAFGLFFLGYTITVALRNWLNNKLLPTTNLDIGISNSISTVFGYIGFIIAAVLGVSAAGFDLSNLAIVAGALSVGVGFGLQSIVNNFVSGLILLAERPIKAGDWIVTAGGEGTVKKISVRSTEIETFDRATVIVPNSTLITDNVTNWTHENKTGRIIICVGVGYDSDPDQVRDILLECATSHNLVLGRPEPVVFFMDFGSSSLDFQLRCFLADINNSLTVTSELRFAILAALRQAKIEIPFPQNDVHIRSDSTKRKTKS